jgi:co-chaperonin GroES (HSP10)
MRRRLLMVEILPAGHRVLIRVKNVEKTKGGIIIAKTIQESEQHCRDHGIVVAIGPTAWDGGEDIWDIHEGDEVVFMRHGGKVMDFDDEIDGYLRIVNDEDIIAKIKRS